jgi:hypothetical protein
LFGNDDHDEFLQLGQRHFWSVLLLVMIVLLVIAVAYLLWKVNHLSNQIVKLEERQRHLDH